MMAAGYSLARDIGALQPRALDWARHSPHLLGEGKCRCESIAYAAKQRSLSDHTHSADSRPIFNPFASTRLGPSQRPLIYERAL